MYDRLQFHYQKLIQILRGFDKTLPNFCDIDCKHMQPEMSGNKSGGVNSQIFFFHTMFVYYENDEG